MTYEKFIEKYTEVATKENYIPRNYQTVGGMWTTDIYEKDNWTAQLMDGGYTKVLTNHETKQRFVCDYNDNIKENIIK